MAIFLKDPGAAVDYAIDWSAGYLTGQTITRSVWRIEPAGTGAVTVVAAAVEPGRTIVTLTGGQAGAVYRITNTVTLSDSRSDERTLVLRVEDR